MRWPIVPKVPKKFVRCQVRAYETYSEAIRQFNDRNRDVLMNARCPHKWFSALKCAVFGSNSSLAPLVGGGGGLVCESVCKVDLLSDHFDGMQCRESVDLPITCHPSPSLTTFAFRKSGARGPLLDFFNYGGTGPSGSFLFFLGELLIFWPHVLV